MTGIDPNYKYWQEHGGVWANEYEERKRRIPLYHVQELMLTEYMAAHANVNAPVRVLEFGCGVGRHLRNISKLPGVEVFGFDQSPTMIDGMRSWAPESWISNHVKLGAPVGALPYADGEFDIVYSTEVLVHVRPEHLEGVLRELLRVARGHVLHLEPAPGIVIHSNVHSGCWGHDLPAAYRSIGRTCETLESGYAAHAPYFVVNQNSPRFTWEHWRLAMYRDLERMLSDGIAAISASATASEIKLSQQERDSADLHRKVIECEARATELHVLNERLFSDLELLRRQFQEAREVSLKELEAARLEIESTQRRIFEPLLAEARQRIEDVEAESRSLQRQLSAEGQIREELSANIVSQQSRIEELSDALRTLHIQHENFTASVKRLVESIDRPIP